MQVRMVGARGDAHKVVGEAFNTIWANGVRPNHHTQIVPLEELVQVIRSEVDDVILFLGISSVVVLEPTLLLTFMWITPQEVEYLLVSLAMVTAKLDFKRSLNRLDGLNILDGWTDTAMHTEYSLGLVGDQGSQWHLLERLVDLGEHAVGVVDVLAEPLSAFFSEAEVSIHILVFVISPKENNLLGILELEGKEEADDLETVLALINIVTKEEVVEGVDISGVAGRLPDIKESHQIVILSMEIADDLYWGSNLLHHNRLCSKDVRALSG